MKRIHIVGSGPRTGTTLITEMSGKGGSFGQAHYQQRPTHWVLER